MKILSIAQKNMLLVIYPNFSRKRMATPFSLRVGTLRVPRALSLSGSLNRFKGTSGLFYFKILN